jgi:hypothetical protein
MDGYYLNLTHGPLAKAAFDGVEGFMEECSIPWFNDTTSTLSELVNTAEAACISTLGCELSFINVSSFVDEYDLLDDADKQRANFSLSGEMSSTEMLPTLREYGFPMCTFANLSARYIENGA